MTAPFPALSLASNASGVTLQMDKTPLTVTAQNAENSNTWPSDSTQSLTGRHPHPTTH